MTVGRQVALPQNRGHLKSGWFIVILAIKVAILVRPYSGQTQIQPCRGTPKIACECESKTMGTDTAMRSTGGFRLGCADPNCLFSVFLRG